MLKIKFYDLFHDFIPSVSPATSVFEMISTEKHIPKMYVTLEIFSESDNFLWPTNRKEKS